MTLCPGEVRTATVAYFNSGSQGWVAGRLGEAAYLGTWGPEPGQDRASQLGGDGNAGSPNTGWPRYNRLAAQPSAYVGPGQVAWFQFAVKAPAVPGTYRLALRPLIEGGQWMEDYGVFWVVTVPTATGAIVPTPTPSNDDWASPENLTYWPITITLNTTTATTAASDPAHSCSSPDRTQKDDKTVWYSFTPSELGRTYLNLAGTTYGSVVSVYTGTIGNLVEVGCELFPSWPISFLSQPNTAYLIEVSDWHTDGVTGGTLNLTMDFAKIAYSWSVRPAPTGAQGFGRIRVDPANDNLWYVTASNGLYVTRDGGNTWERHLSGKTRGLAVDPKAPNRVYAGSDNQLYRSENRGVTWSLVKQFPTDQSVHSVLVSSIDSSVFVGMYWGYSQDPNGIYTSGDYGQTWTFYPFNLSALPYDQDKWLITWDLAEDPSNGYLYAAIEPARDSTPQCTPSCYSSPWLRSKDRGQTWQNTMTGAGWHATSVQVQPVSSDVYHQIEGGVIFVSHDFGDTRAAKAQTWGVELLIDPLDPTRFFSGSLNGTGVRLSMDSGQNFRQIGPANVSGPGEVRLALNGTSTRLYASYGGAPNAVYVTDLSPSRPPNADLVITSPVTVTPIAVAPGGTVTRSDFTLSNQGTALASAFRIGYYLSTDATITAADILLGFAGSGPRAARATVTYGQGPLTIPPGTPPGAYFLGVLLDDQNAVAESNESNNFGSAALTVSGP